MRRLALLLAALALAGCGGDPGGADGPPQTDGKPSSNQNPDRTMGVP